MQDYNSINKHDNRGKKLLIGGLTALVLTGSAVVYALNPFNHEEIPPVPYTPPEITTPAPTDNTTITPTETTTTETPKEKLTLEDLFKDKPEYFEVPELKSATADDIKNWMTYALEISSYNPNKHGFPDLPKYIHEERRELENKWLDSALYALRISNFDEKKVLALYEAMDVWKYGGSVPLDKVVDTREWSEKNAPRMANDPDKEGTINRIKYNLETILGMPYGFGKE